MKDTEENKTMKTQPFMTQFPLNVNVATYLIGSKGKWCVWLYKMVC